VGEVLHPPVGRALAADLREAIDWKWLGAALEAAESTGLHSMTLWAAEAHTHSCPSCPLHPALSAHRRLCNGAL